LTTKGGQDLTRHKPIFFVVLASGCYMVSPTNTLGFETADRITCVMKK